VLLAKRKKINPFTTHANLIGLFLEGKESFSTYLTTLVDNSQSLAARDMSVYDLDRHMSKVVIHLAFRVADKVPHKPSQDYEREDWQIIRELLLDRAYA
jgi:hypothetical protein